MNEILTKQTCKVIITCFKRKGFFPYIKWSKNCNLKDNYGDTGASIKDNNESNI